MFCGWKMLPKIRYRNSPPTGIAPHYLKINFLKSYSLRGFWGQKVPKIAPFLIPWLWGHTEKNWKWDDPIFNIWYHYTFPQLVKYQIWAQNSHFYRNYDKKRKKIHVKKWPFWGLFFSLTYTCTNLKYYLIQIQRGPYHSPK